MIENILNNFDKLMDSSLDKLKSIEKQNIHNGNAEKIKYESIESKNSYLIKKTKYLLKKTLKMRVRMNFIVK